MSRLLQSIHSQCLLMWYFNKAVQRIADYMFSSSHPMSKSVSATNTKGHHRRHFTAAFFTESAAEKGFRPETSSLLLHIRAVAGMGSILVALVPPSTDVAVSLSLLLPALLASSIGSWADEH